MFIWRLDSKLQFYLLQWSGRFVEGGDTFTFGKYGRTRMQEKEARHRLTRVHNISLFTFLLFFLDFMVVAII